MRSMLGYKPLTTPIEPKIKYGTFEDIAPIQKGKYQKLVGRLIYLSHTQLDITFAVGTLC